MTPTIMMLSCILAWMPTIDQQRFPLNEAGLIVAGDSYWLGVSCPPDEIVNLSVTWGDLSLELDNFSGTNFYLAHIEPILPVRFYQDGEYIGQIIPEPCTLLLLTAGAMFARKRLL